MKGAKPTGRPPKPSSGRRDIRLRVDRDVKGALDAMAFGERRTVSNLVEVLVDESLEARKHRRNHHG